MVACTTRRSDDLELIRARQRLERHAGKGLVPERDRSDVVLQRQVAAILLFGASAERPDRDAQVALAMLMCLRLLTAGSWTCPS
jgi:hypothetical protein